MISCRPSILRSVLAAACWLALLPAAAPAAELEYDLVLEGFPFSSAASTALSGDGRDLYASGAGSAGLVWLRRDLATGELDFRRNYFSDGFDTATVGVVLGRNEVFLYALREDEITTLLRRTDGSLQNWQYVELPASFTPDSLFLAPAGDQLVVLGRPPESPYRLQALIFALDANGRATLVQTLEGGFRNRTLGVLSDDLLFSGRSLLRRSGGTWSVQEIPGFAADPALQAWQASASGRYLYATALRGTIPFIGHHLVTLELQGGNWVQVAEISLRNNFERELTAFALNPQSGDLYSASYDTNGGSVARIDHFRSQEGGRSFAFAEELDDPTQIGYGKSAKYQLDFSPDGRHLYANFAAEPMALIEVDPGDGRLSPVEHAAGLRSHLERPFKILPLAGDIYVLTPAAVLQTRFGGAAAEIRSSLDFATWTSSFQRPFVDLVLTPGGGAGAITNGDDLAFVERDRTSGALRIRNETSLRPGGVRSLTLSPDGRYVYAIGYFGIAVYFLRRDVPKLVPVQELETSSTVLRIAPNGLDAVLIDSNGAPFYFSRDNQTGLLSVATGPARTRLTDAFFLAAGRLALIGFDPVQRRGRFELFRRGPGGEWISEMTENFESAAEARQMFDGESHYFYQLAGTDLKQLALTPQFDSFGLVAWRNHVVQPLTSFPPQVSDLAFEPGEESLLVSDAPAGNVRRFRRGCGLLFAGACLAEQRFRVDVIWRTADRQGPALQLAIGSDDSQVFGFFDGDNWEVLAKVLDGCAINGRFWVFAAASTDLAFDLLVSDTWTGQRKVYSNAAGIPAPAITDTGAFATCEAASPGWSAQGHGREDLAENTNGLRLGQDFEAKVGWTTAAGQQGSGTGLETIPASASGLFYFFDSSNWEMQVKVLDGCALNGYHWVFGAATTDVGYQLEVTERSSGRRRVYTNPVGTPSRAITDIKAFSCD